MKKTNKFKSIDDWGKKSILTINKKKVSPFKLYNYFMEKAFNETPLYQMFNMSIPVQFNSNGNMIKTLNRTVFTENYAEKSNNLTESLIVDDNGNFRKCFTLFKTSPNKGPIKIDYHKIEIIINSNENWYEKAFSNVRNNYYLFLIHKPSFIPLPDENSFIRLQPNKEYIVLYSRIKKHLLKSPYTTNCVDYIKTNESQDYCIVYCLFEKELLECGYCAPRFNLHLKSADVYQDKSIHLCPSQNCKRSYWLKEAQNQCKSKCAPDCYTEFYEFYETSDRDLKEQRITSVNRTIIKLIHKTIPDVEIKHFPEFTSSSYVANMGGLAGMWDK